MRVIFNQSMYNVIIEMGKRQETEKQEQFGTGYGQIRLDENGEEVLYLDTFESWPREILGASASDSIEISQEAWGWVLENMYSKDANFLVTIHTHPEWYGTDRNLNTTDRETFESWSNFFSSQYKIPDLININGIYSPNGGLRLYIFDKKTREFKYVDGVVSEKKYAKLPIRH